MDPWLPRRAVGAAARTIRRDRPAATPSIWLSTSPPAGRPPAAAAPPGPRPRRPAAPSRGAGRTAHTLLPRSSARTPQLEDRCSTMPRPRPPIEDSDGRDARGRVVLPPSLTTTSTVDGEIIQATRIRASGSGRACRIALLRSSLVTRAASATAVAGRPAARSSAAIRPRATATLDGTHGSRTTLAALTSLRAPPRGRDSRLPPASGNAPPAGPGNRVGRPRANPSQGTGDPV
jgi:hypothetical protein